MKAYLLNLIGALSQLLNALLGGYRDNSLSVRTKWYWLERPAMLQQPAPVSVRILAWIINGLMRDPRHVQNQQATMLPNAEIVPLPVALGYAVCLTCLLLNSSILLMIIR